MQNIIFLILIYDFKKNLEFFIYKNILNYNKLYWVFFMVFFMYIVSWCNMEWDQNDRFNFKNF